MTDNPTDSASTDGSIFVSVVIPVYNEEDNLEQLFGRLYPVMEAYGKPFEIIFVNDGSRDRSMELLTECHRQHPRHVRVIDFNGNYGQHMAVIAAFEKAQGEVIVALDADLQNPPEEIPKLLVEYEKGHDCVGSYRKRRRDSAIRRWPSRLINHIRERTTHIRMRDQGCMLRAYSRDIVRAITLSNERSTFIPALGWLFASNPTEVEVAHEERHAGESKYRIYDLIRLNFDLITGTTLVPLQLFTLFGFATAAANFLLVFILFFRRFIWPGAAEAEGVFTLFAILFFLVSVAIVGLGLIGEYVGRTYQSVQQRPRYLIRKYLGDPDS